MRPHSSRGRRRGGPDIGRHGGGGDMSWLAMVGVVEEEERKLVTGGSKCSRLQQHCTCEHY